MAWRRASLASFVVLRSSAVMRPLVAGSVDSEALESSVHWGQRLAKPGLSGFSSNSSEQTTQVLIGKAIPVHDTTLAIDLRLEWRLREREHEGGGG